MSRSKTYERIKVAVRCRPLSEDEISLGYRSIVKINNGNEVEIKDPKYDDARRIRKFPFDVAFWEDCDQRQVYEQTVRPLIDSVLKGFNSTIFAYGQSGSGKTYTMEGDTKADNDTGIIPRAMLHIFDSISKSSNVQYLVRVAYLEIYKDEIRDLLSDEIPQNCVIKESKDSGVYVNNLKAFVCNNLKQAKAVISAGRKKRSTGETNLNDKSSRSHAVLTVTVEMKDMVGPLEHQVRVGKLNLVDLAGSERQIKTNAQGARLKEANKINLSLTSLGKVISALTSKKVSHIPYRDSKLTRLLSDSLGGNSKTLMIANIGPADFNYSESSSTLRFASRVSTIKNKPTINEDPTDALLRMYQEEIKRLESELKLRNNKKTGKLMETKKINTFDVTGSPGQSLIRKFDKLSTSLNSNADVSFDQKLLDELTNRIALVESKILPGTSSILQHTNKQQMALNKRNDVIKESIQREKDMQEILELQSENTDEIWNEYSNLFIEVGNKRKDLKHNLDNLEEINQQVITAQNQFNVDRQELENIRHQLIKDIKQKILILENFVPLQDRRKILEKLQFNNEVESWKVVQENRPEASLSRLKSVASSRRPFTTYSTISRRKAEYMYQRKQSPDWEKQTFRYRGENILSLNLTYLPKSTKHYVPPIVLPGGVQNYLRNALYEEDHLDIDAGNSKYSTIAKRKRHIDKARRKSDDLLSVMNDEISNQIKKTSLVYPKARGLIPHKIFSNMT